MDKKRSLVFYIELAAAVLISAVASCAAFSNILTASNELFNVTSDALGHLAKVNYLAEHYKNFQFPSWCPFWYNGSTMMQYYPPLGYIFMAFVQMLAKNINITMKIYCFLSLFVGGMGIWAICRRFIGKWCGLFGIVIYCMQPFLSLSLFSAGVLAQGVIFLISPWFLFFVIIYLQKPQKGTFLLISVITFLLILSHAMHAFMECLCIAVVAFPYVLNKKIKLRSFFSLGISMAVGALLCGFWWSVGVTGYEAPGIPYLLEEATLLYTANLEWFIPGVMPLAGLKFGFAAQVCSVAGFLIYKLQFRKRGGDEPRRFCVSYCTYLTLFTIIFSFGQNIKIFKLVPMISSLVPGRILSMSSITAAVMGAYIVYALFGLSAKNGIGLKALATALGIFIIFFAVYDMNPYKSTYAMMDYNEYYNEYMPYMQGEGEAFEKGRYEWIAPVNCAETYYSTVKYGFNTSDGWNIEGTPHNRTIWNYNIALSSDAEEYIAKDLLYWNVRSLYTLTERTKLLGALEKYGFKPAAWQSEKYSKKGVLYTNDSPSSYFLIDRRDCLVIGESAGAVALEFPFMVHNIETDITKLSMDELKRYKIIYIVDPKLKTMTQVKKFEGVITELLSRGIHIIIEPSNVQNIPIFGVASYDFNNGPNCMLTKQADSGFKSKVDNVSFGSNQLFRGLVGLDEVFYNLYSENERVSNSIIGTKDVGDGKVYFVGMHLSQYLKSTNISIYGFRQGAEYPFADIAKELLGDIFNLKMHNESFVPDASTVEKSEWNYNGCNFSYSSDKQQEILVSVTHTPRWKIKIDGKRTEYKSRENLVVLTLPEGTHRVEMVYGISPLGAVGYIISIIGLCLLLTIYVLFDESMKMSIKLGNFLSNWFELS